MDGLDDDSVVADGAPCISGDLPAVIGGGLGDLEASLRCAGAGSDVGVPGLDWYPRPLSDAFDDARGDLVGDCDDQTIIFPVWGGSVAGHVTLPYLSNELDTVSI